MSWSACSTPTTTTPAPLPSMASSSSSSNPAPPAVRPPTTTFLLSPTTTSSPTYTNLRPLTPTLDLLHPSRVRPLSESLCLSPRRPPPLLSTSDIFSFNFLDSEPSPFPPSSPSTTTTSHHLPLSPFQAPLHRSSQQQQHHAHHHLHQAHRFEPSIHSSGPSSQEFEREIQALELWFMDLNDSVKSKTLYTLVQHISPEQARFFTMVLGTIAKRDEQVFSATNAVDTAIKARPFQEKNNVPTRTAPVPWHLDLSLPKNVLFRPQSPAPIGASRPSSPLNPSIQISTGQSFFSPSPSPPLSTTASPLAPPSSPARLTPLAPPPGLSIQLNSTPSYIASPSPSPSPSTRFIPQYQDHRFKKYNTTPRPPPRSWKDPIDFALLKDIPGWLRSLRLHKYTALFHPQYTWRQMIELTDEDLTKLGVSALGARNKFLKVFQQVKASLEETKDAASPATESASPSSSVSDKPAKILSSEAKTVAASS